MALKPSSKPRLRAAACTHRAPASMLRLSHAGTAARLPSGAALSSWLRRAALPFSSEPQFSR